MSVNIEEYFRSRTREISYQRNHFERVWVAGNDICMEHYLYQNHMPEDAAPEDERLAFIKRMQGYGRNTLCDNRQLVMALEAIADAETSGVWDATSGFLQELLPYWRLSIPMRTWVDDLRSLMMLFHCYRVIVWEERQLPAAYRAYLAEIIKLTDAISAPLEEQCWEFISYMIMVFHDETITCGMHLNGHVLEERLSARSLYSALVYQLLLHIAAGKDGLNGASIAVCESCRQAFMKEHGNQRFCKICRTPSNRVRSCRQRKKEATAHAPQDHP